MARFSLRIGFALLFFSLQSASAWADMEVYHPKHRLAEDLVPLVEVALSDGGRVAVDSHSNALVLVGTAAEISQALGLLALQDKALRTVLIHHETRTASDLEASGARITWSAGGNAVRVGNVARGSGLSVRVDQRTRQGVGSQSGSLRVLEGEWGRIASGSEVLLPTGSWRYPDAVRVSAESGLEVRPRILGDGRVRLDLRPFQGNLGRGGVVSHSGADTVLVVTPGETAVVGGIGGSRSNRGSSLLSGGGSATEQRQQLLLVTVTVDGDAGEGAR